MQSIWTEYKLSAGTYRLHRFGDLTVAVLRTPNEWQVASTKLPVELPREGEIESLAQFSDRTRWVIDPKIKAYSLRPRLPNQPLMTTPHAPIQLPPGTATTVYLEIPTTVEVCCQHAKSPLVLASFDSQKLSKTWNGDRTNGQLCLSLNTAVIHQLENIQIAEEIAIAPVSIYNQSNIPFLFDTFFFDTNSINLYLAGVDLWTDLTKIIIHSGDQPPTVKIINAPPHEIKASKPNKIRNCDATRNTALKKIFGSFSFSNLTSS